MPALEVEKVAFGAVFVELLGFGWGVELPPTLPLLLGVLLLVELLLALLLLLFWEMLKTVLGATFSQDLFAKTR